MAREPLDLQLHYMNYTEGPIITEVWVNFWYRDPQDVTEPAREVFSMYSFHSGVACTFFMRST